MSNKHEAIIEVRKLKKEIAGLREEINKLRGQLLDLSLTRQVQFVPATPIYPDAVPVQPLTPSWPYRLPYVGDAPPFDHGTVTCIMNDNIARY